MFEPEEFRPVWPLRNPHMQTILSSSRMRSWYQRPASFNPTQMVLNVGNARLLGYYIAATRPKPKGLVILLHGWEGSVSSTYIMRTAKTLHLSGYSVFLLNYRDHGESHHLNEGLFYASQLDEVFQAVVQAGRLSSGGPVFLVGFSLGGNFALRIARSAIKEPIDGLRHVVCISPLLDPATAVDRIDAIAYIRRYFLGKWYRSLLKKQTLFPHRYDFDDLTTVKSVRKLTELLLQRYSRYGSAQEYYDEYTLLGDALIQIDVPTTLLTAADDPIIAVDDFHSLRRSIKTRLAVQAYGGHNGFISDFALNGWYEPRLAALFDSVSEDMAHSDER
jgi:predicted alpha/beta-fold hydrolase